MLKNIFWIKKKHNEIIHFDFLNQKNFVNKIDTNLKELQNKAKYYKSNKFGGKIKSLLETAKNKLEAFLGLKINNLVLIILMMILVIVQICTVILLIKYINKYNKIKKKISYDSLSDPLILLNQGRKTPPVNADIEQNKKKVLKRVKRAPKIEIYRTPEEIRAKKIARKIRRKQFAARKRKREQLENNKKNV